MFVKSSRGRQPGGQVFNKARRNGQIISESRQVTGTEPGSGPDRNRCTTHSLEEIPPTPGAARALVERAADGGGKLLVVGPPRRGKATLLKQLVRRDALRSLSGRGHRAWLKDDVAALAAVLEHGVRGGGVG